MELAERTVLMPEISASVKQDVFFIVLAEMIEGSIQRIQQQCPELMQFMDQGETFGR